jgi:hypothetical protein
MLKVHHESGSYDVCTELGETFGRVIRIRPAPADDGVDDLPRVREFDLHTYITVHKSLPESIEFDALGFTDVDGRSHTAFSF